jgi:hypothetical protein
VLAELDDTFDTMYVTPRQLGRAVRDAAEGSGAGCDVLDPLDALRADNRL